MCVNYRPTGPDQLADLLGISLPAHLGWSDETWKDYLAPILLASPGRPRVLRLASYDMVPRDRIPAGVKPFDTMNARAETLATRHSFSSAWRNLQLCAVPMTCFYEPCYESGKPERYGIGMANGRPFFAAGLWREWPGSDGAVSTSFTQLTINADTHRLMRRMHRPDDEKRTLAILRAEELTAWLACTSTEQAAAFLRHFPAEEMCAWPAPRAAEVRCTTGSLF